MTHRLLAAGLLFATFVPAFASAQGAVDPPRSEACLRELYDAFGREHRLARAVLYGKPSAADAPVTSVYYDDDGDPWVKTGDDEWTSPSDEFDGETWTNDDMDEQGETDLLCNDPSDTVSGSCVKLPRRGIFEIRKTPTSDLILPITQTVRALQCRLRAVCELAARSPVAQGPTITIEIDGCLPMTYPVMQGCRNAPSTLFTTLPGNCQAARRELVRREMQLLTLATSYDANYRSLAQFAGIFQEFLTRFRFPLIEPLWQTVRTLGGLKEIPCFQSECNE